MDQEFATADRQRKEDFARQEQERQQQFEMERRERANALKEHLQQIEESGKAVNSRAAQLEREMNDLREQWRRDDLARQRSLEEQDFEERLVAERAHRDQLLAEAENWWGQFMKIFQQMPQVDYSQAVAPRENFASGLRFVPYNDFPANLHFGEEVLNKSQADAHRAGGGGVNVHIYNTVGDLATMSKLQEYQDTTIDGVKQAFASATGRGEF